MNRNIRHLAVGLMVAFFVLFAMLNYVQFFAADELNEHPLNTRGLVSDLDQPRGSIISADGAVLADTESVEDGPFDFRRTYPSGDLFAHLTGHFGLVVESTGLERSWNAELTGRDQGFDLDSISDFIGNEASTRTLRLSIDAAVQTAARDALGERRGSVVAIDPRDGRVLALWSWPSYDPNRLADLESQAALDAYEILDDDENQPLVGRAWRQRDFPGSTFKIVTAAAGLELGTVGLTEPVYPDTDSWTPPNTSRPVRNFGGSSCGGDLADLIRRSCNTGFAEMAIEQIGPEQLVEVAESFGFNSAVPVDLPGAVESVFPTDYGDLRSEEGGPGSRWTDIPRLAQTSIGQNDVAASPLQMALVAAAVANEGDMMVPRVVAEVLDAEGEVVRQIEPEVWRRPVTPKSAGQLSEAMRGVVTDGTAKSVAIEGVTVGAKTGTAQLGTDPPRSHAWIMGFAGPSAEPDPTLAFAVLVEADPADPGITGGATAGPVARGLIEAVLADQARDAVADEAS